MGTNYPPQVSCSWARAMPHLAPATVPLPHCSSRCTLACLSTRWTTAATCRCVRPLGNLVLLLRECGCVWVAGVCAIFVTLTGTYVLRRSKLLNSLFVSFLNSTCFLPNHLIYLLILVKMVSHFYRVIRQSGCFVYGLNHASQS